MKFKTTNPKKLIQFFQDKVTADESVVIKTDGRELYVETSAHNEDPEDAVGSFRVRKADWLAFLKVVNALVNRRPIKLVSDTKAYWKIHVGPKP